MPAINPDVLIPGEDVDKQALRDTLVGVRDRVGSLPDDYTGQGGMVITVLEDESGPGIPNRDVRFNGHGVNGFRITGLDDPVTTSIILSNSAHGGRLLKCTNGSPITITINSGNVSSGFNCRIWRRGAGTVTVVFVGLTNTNADGRSGVASGKMCEILVDPHGSGEVYFDGGTV